MGIRSGYLQGQRVERAHYFQPPSPKFEDTYKEIKQDMLVAPLQPQHLGGRGRWSLVQRSLGYTVRVCLSPSPFLPLLPLPSLPLSLLGYIHVQNLIVVIGICCKWKENRSELYASFVSHRTILLKKPLSWFKEALDYIIYRASSVSPEQAESRQQPVKSTASQVGQTSQHLFQI